MHSRVKEGEEGRRARRQGMGQGKQEQLRLSIIYNAYNAIIVAPQMTSDLSITARVPVSSCHSSDYCACHGVLWERWSRREGREGRR